MYKLRNYRIHFSHNERDQMCRHILGILKFNIIIVYLHVKSFCYIIAQPSSGNSMSYNFCNTVISGEDYFYN